MTIRRVPHPGPRQRVTAEHKCRPGRQHCGELTQLGQLFRLSGSPLLRPGRLRDRRWRGQPGCLEQLRQASYLAGGRRSRDRAQDDAPHVLQRKEPERVPAQAFADGRVSRLSRGITLQPGDGKAVREFTLPGDRLDLLPEPARPPWNPKLPELQLPRALEVLRLTAQLGEDVTGGKAALPRLARDDE